MMLARKVVAFFIFIFSGIETSHAFDGVLIHENKNDVELYHLSSSICQNNVTGNTTKLLSSNHSGFCGFQCQSDQNKFSSVYYQSETSTSTCKDDSNILLENGCTYGIRNDIRMDKLQVLTSEELQIQSTIYHRDLSGSIAVAQNCKLQNGLCSVKYRNFSSGWQQISLAECFTFKDGALKFTCKNGKFTKLEGLLLMVDLKCDLTREQKSLNSCTIFKISGIFNDNTSLSSAAECFPAIPVSKSTISPLHKENFNFMDIYGWLIVGLLSFIIVVIVLVLCLFYCRKRRGYSLKRRRMTDIEMVVQDQSNIKSKRKKKPNEVVLKRHANLADEEVTTANSKQIKHSNGARLKSFESRNFSDETDGLPNGSFCANSKIIPAERANVLVSKKKAESNSSVNFHDNKNPVNKPDTSRINPYAEINELQISTTKSNTNSLIRPYAEIKDFAFCNPAEEDEVNTQNLAELGKGLKPFGKEMPTNSNQTASSKENTYLQPTDDMKTESSDKKGKKPFWKSKTLTRDQSPYTKLKNQNVNTDDSSSSDDDKNDSRQKNIISSGGLNTLPFDNITARKSNYYNNTTILPIEALTRVSDTNKSQSESVKQSFAFSDTTSDGESSTTFNDNVSELEPDSESNSSGFETSENSNNNNDTKNSKPDSNLIVPYENLKNKDNEYGLEKISNCGSPPALPRKLRTGLFYRNVATTIDEIYSKPHFPPIVACVDDSTKTYYDVVPTIKGDKHSSININFRRPVPDELELIRLPYSQFNYGLRDRKEGNSSCNGFCLLLANYFVNSKEFTLEDLKQIIPDFLHRAETIWNDNNIGSTIIEEADEVLKKSAGFEYVSNIEEETFWSINHGLGGNSAYDALHDLYDQCVRSNQKNCLVFTFYPDKSCLCLFDEFGTQFFIDMHIHFKHNHQDRSEALNGNTCGGVICKAERQTSDILLNFIITNMCLEMKADPMTGSVYPIHLNANIVDYI